MSTNGKGDKSRVRDTKRFRQNYDEIDWGLSVSHARREYAAMWKEVIEKLGIESKKRMLNAARNYLKNNAT